ncbi:hypothetical protein K443DRAFT_682949, partial [Laccaria amethystina LaAM-08-1]
MYCGHRPLSLILGVQLPIGDASFPPPLAPLHAPCPILGVQPPIGNVSLPPPLAPFDIPSPILG